MSDNDYTHEANNAEFSERTLAESAVSKPSYHGVSREAAKARREYAVGLKIAGMSISTIVFQINEQSDIKGWGKVHRGIVEKDIAQYYRETAPLREGEYDHLEQMRNVHISQMENTAEKLAILISKKTKNNEWKPFEEADAIEKLHKMQMNLAEIHDWNMGRKNPLISIQQNDVTAIYDAAAVAIMKAGDKNPMKELSALLRDTAAEMREREKLEITASEGKIIEAVQSSEQVVESQTAQQ